MCGNIIGVKSGKSVLSLHRQKKNLVETKERKAQRGYLGQSMADLAFAN